MEPQQQAQPEVPPQDAMPEAAMGTFGQEQQETESRQLSSIAPSPVAAAKKQLPKLDLGTVVLVLLIGLGGAAVYVLKSHCGPAKASAHEIRTRENVDRVLQRLDIEQVGTQDKTAAIVGDFYYEPRQRQVPPEKVGENPFHIRLNPALDGSLADAEDSGAEEDRSSEELAREQAEMAEAISRLNKLQLQSTIIRPDGRSTAMISDFVLRPGMTIQDWQILAIRPGEVDVKWQSMVRTLSMPN